MIAPNWQSNFRNLPTITFLKQWKPGQLNTIEQDIMQKVQKGLMLTQIESFALKSLVQFYADLNHSLQRLDYKSFSEADFNKFRDYIFYAFNHIFLVSNRIFISSTYRLVVNEWTTGENTTISNSRFLKYPTLDIVKKFNKYNRANTPATNVFYCSEDMDTCIKESRPPKDKLITIGVWKPKSNRELVSFPISHNIAAEKANPRVARATAALQKTGFRPELEEYMKNYFSLLSHEYTKKISHHYEYLISSLFSERILETQDKNYEDFRYECIVYPSVGNDFVTSNVAMLPSVLDQQFFLSSAIEFEIEEDYYHKKHLPGNPEVISLAKIKNLRTSKSIDAEGNISW